MRGAGVSSRRTLRLRETQCQSAVRQSPARDSMSRGHASLCPPELSLQVEVPASAWSVTSLLAASEESSSSEVILLP